MSGWRTNANCPRHREFSGRCSVHSSGVAICRNPAFWLETDTPREKDGESYIIIRPDGSEPESHPPTESEWKQQPDTPERVHAVLDGILAELGVSPKHRQAFEARGLTIEEWERLGYRSNGSSPDTTRAIVASVLRRLGRKHVSVPGLYRVRNGAYSLAASKRGFLLPVRDVQGFIRALRLRCDPEEIQQGAAKYLWVSKPARDGIDDGVESAPLNWYCHVPLHDESLDTSTVRITEGELKSDFATLRTEILTVSIPGAGLWAKSLPVLKDLGAKRVLLAYDSDAWTNKRVAGCLQAFAERLCRDGLEVALEVWPAECGKGIDDVIKAGHMAQVRVLDGLAAFDSIGQAVAFTGARPSPLAGLEARVAAEGPAVMFEPEVIASLFELRKTNAADFQRLKATARKHGVARDLEGQIRDFGLNKNKGKPSRSESTSETSSAVSEVADAAPQAAANDRPELVKHRWTAPGARPGEMFGAKPGEMFCTREKITKDGPETELIYVCRTSSCVATEALDVLDAPEAAPKRWLRFSMVRGQDKEQFCDVSLADFLNEPPEANGLGTPLPRMAAEFRYISTRGDLAALPRRNVFGFVGRTVVQGKPVYLSARGAIAAENDSADDVQVVTPSTPEGRRIASFSIETPETADATARAVRAGLFVLNLRPAEVFVAGVCGVFAAALGHCAWSIFLAARGASGKSEIAALLQRFFGRTMDRHHLPVKLERTSAPGALAVLGAIGDAIVVCDDYRTTGKEGSAEAVVNAIVRGAHDRGAEGKSTRGGSLRSDKRARAAVMFTGESPPIGLTTIQRTLLIQVPSWPGRNAPQHERDAWGSDIGPGSEAYELASSGELERCTGGFIRWALGKEFPLLDLEFPNTNDRTAAMLCALATGGRAFLGFARDLGILSGAEHLAQWERIIEVLRSIGARQHAHHQVEEPHRLALRALRASFESKAGFVTALDGASPPEHAYRWGWLKRAALIEGLRADEPYSPPNRPSLGILCTPPKRPRPVLLLAAGPALAAIKKQCAEWGTSFPFLNEESFSRCLFDAGLLVETERTPGDPRSNFGKRITQARPGSPRGRYLWLAPEAVFDDEGADTPPANANESKAEAPTDEGIFQL